MKREHVTLARITDLCDIIKKHAKGTVVDLPTSDLDDPERGYYRVTIFDTLAGTIILHATVIPSKAASEELVQLGPRLNICGINRMCRNKRFVQEMLSELKHFVKP